MNKTAVKELHFILHSSAPGLYYCLSYINKCSSLVSLVHSQKMSLELGSVLISLLFLILIGNSINKIPKKQDSVKIVINITNKHSYIAAWKIHRNGTEKKKLEVIIALASIPLSHP